MAKCSDLMSLGDNVQHMCMREQQWGMLHDVGRLCCVLPASLMRGWIHYVAFPAQLGKFNVIKKSKRLLREIKEFGGTHLYANKMAV